LGTTRSLPFRAAQIALAAVALSGVVSTALGQAPTENLIIAFAPVNVSSSIAAVPLSIELTVAIALALAVTAFVILRRRGVSGSPLSGWLLALGACASLVAIGGELISEARAALPPAAINLSVSPGTLNLDNYWQSNVDPLTVTVTNTTNQSVRITSVTTDNTNEYILSTPTTCVAGTVLSPNAQCTVTLSIQ